ncbi:MAG: hypothetical protein IJM54_06645 [Thermoguttaceae bacterium]|nr:hypothetical protein [Thermoguttaceae bacterium]
MNEIFNVYASREELDKALDAAIEQSTDESGKSVFRLRNVAADEYLAQRDAAERKAAAEIKRREELEKKLQALVDERADVDAELERLRADAVEPGELRAAIQRYADHASASRARAAALEAEIKPLREENAAYKERETRAAIEAQLVETARKLNCCESALRDVKRLAPMFKLNDEGVAQTQDMRSVEETLKEELALSPHWLNRSQGAAASAGSVDANSYANRERFQRALEGTNFADVLTYAPRQKVDRLY